MLIFDMHCDTLLRTAQTGEPFFSGRNEKGSLPRIQFAAAFVGDEKTAPERRGRALALLDEFDRAATEVTPVTDREGLCRLVADGGSGILLSVEGGGGVDENSLSFLDTLFTRGVRVFGLSWADNELAASANSSDTRGDYGLTPLGEAALARALSLGMIPDVSHLSRRAFAAVAEKTEGVLLATHSNLYPAAPHPRNLLPEEAREIARRGGVIGLNIYPAFLAGGDIGDCLSMTEALLSEVGEDAVGFGFDVDGIETYPSGFPAGVPLHETMIEALLKIYPHAVVEKIAGGNVFRVLSENLPR